MKPPVGCHHRRAMAAETTLEITEADAAEAPGRDLLAAMVAELDSLYGANSTIGTPSATPAELGPPHGRFLLASEDGDAVAIGALKRLDEETAEIKRMYVVPAARGRGHARRMLGALEDAARELGYRRVRLDTGPSQPHALALYESAGFGRIDDYNANPRAAFWFEKALRPPT